MPPEPHDGLRDDRMDDREIDEFLRDRGYGVLSLADGGDAYGVPISFGYDGESRLFFVFLQTRERSEKATFAETTDRATLTAVVVGSKHEWRSVVVSGPVRRIDDGEWDELRDAIEENAWYPSLFSAAEPMREIQGWELRIEERSGRTSA